MTDRVIQKALCLRQKREIAVKNKREQLYRERATATRAQKIAKRKEVLRRDPVRSRTERERITNEPETKPETV